MALRRPMPARILHRRLLDLAAGLLAFLLPLAAYLRTLAPAEVGGDAGEFQVVPAVLGIPHYTGYPLYTLLGRLWLAVDPLGSVALRMNALSAVCGALACVLVYAGVRAAGGGLLGGLVGAGTLAVTALEWRWSTIAGVRAAAAAFSALVLALAFSWGAAARAARRHRAEARRAAVAAEAAARRRWLWPCLGLGLALAHHRSSAFFLPALALYALLCNPRLFRQGRLLAAGAALAALPLLLYLYLPLRSAAGAPYDQLHPSTWPAFVELVFAPHLTRALMTIPPASFPARAVLLGQALREQLGPLTWFAAAGLVTALIARRAELAATALFGLLVCMQVLDWNIPSGLNLVYLIPVLVVCAYLAAAGAEGAMALLRRLFGGRELLAAAVVGIVALVALAAPARETYTAQRAAARLTLDAYHQDLTTGWRGHRLAAAALPYLDPRGVIAADWEQATIFWYQKLVARTLPSVDIDFGAGSLAELSPALLAQRYPGRPLYLARSVPWAAGHHPSAAGPLIALSDAPHTTAPPGIAPLNVHLEGGMQLLGYQLFDERGERVAAEPSGSPVLAVMLVWKASERQTHDLSISLRLLNGDGAVVRSADSAGPVYGLAPTTSWAVGEVVADYDELPLSGLAAGDYRLQALLYYQLTPGTFHNLQTLAPTGVPAGQGVVVTGVRR